MGIFLLQVCKLVIEAARQLGKKIVLVRHPMPYGDLAKQAVQRFETVDDLDKHHTTIEEREEYEQHIKNGVVVYAGVVGSVSAYCASIHCVLYRFCPWHGCLCALCPRDMM